MKIAIGLLLVCLLCLIAVPVDAGSFGISPAVISIQLHRGSSSTFNFIVSSYNGLVEINSEGMPVTITPSSVNAIAGSPITVTIGCKDDAVSGIYDGRIVFLAKSGDSVQAGIKVICNFTVIGVISNLVVPPVEAGQSTKLVVPPTEDIQRTSPVVPPIEDVQYVIPSVEVEQPTSPNVLVIIGGGFLFLLLIIGIIYLIRRIRSE